MLLLPTRPDQRGACQLTRASTIKTGVMGNATVINSREGNEVTVDSQFSQRKLAFITHLILRSKQVSCARLSRGIWQLLLQKPSSWCRWKEGNSKNKLNRGRRKKEEENISITKANEIHLAVLYDEAAKQMLTINGAIRWYISDCCNVAFFSSLWCFLAANFCGVTAITFTRSPLFLCPISFAIKLSEKHEAVINYRGGVGCRAATYCHYGLEEKL